MVRAVFFTHCRNKVDHAVFICCSFKEVIFSAKLLIPDYHKYSMLLENELKPDNLIHQQIIQKFQQPVNPQPNGKFDY